MRGKQATALFFFIFSFFSNCLLRHVAGHLACCLLCLPAVVCSPWAQTRNYAAVPHSLSLALTPPLSVSHLQPLVPPPFLSESGLQSTSSSQSAAVAAAAVCWERSRRGRGRRSSPALGCPFEERQNLRTNVELFYFYFFSPAP